jgi:predicted amidohydrolase YtcJ
MTNTIGALACALLGAAVLTAQTPPAELLIVNARVFTATESRPWAEAVLTRGERIVAVGSTSEVRGQAGAAARVIDAGGRLLIPGINDAHTHPGAAPPTRWIDAPPAMDEDPALDVVLERLRATIATHPGSDWIRGEIGGRVLEDPRATRTVLDPITGDRPVMLASWHGHGVVLNTAAMRALGIGAQDPDPPGGFYGRAADGRTLSGLAHEYADYRIRRQYAMLADPAAQSSAYRTYAAEAAAFGITSIQAMMTGRPAVGAGRAFADARLPVRVRVIDFPFTSMPDWRQPAARHASALVSESGTKWILDGTPIERLMFLREPFADAPDTRGRRNFTSADLRAFLGRALASGEQPLFHAVGDAAIDELLTALEATGGARWRPLRPRLEHGDLMEPGHFARAKAVGLVLVQNPSHFMVGPIMQARLGSRVARTAMVRSAVAAGVPFAIGSDGPLNPFLNIMFATINAVNPAEALTVEQAVIAYTRGAAFAEHAEQDKGTLAPGTLADFALLSQDIFRVPPPALPQTASVLTVVGGRIVHEVR